MNPTPPGGTMLLTADEAAAVLGGSPDRAAFLASRGFLSAIVTARGVKYREDELLALRAVLPPPRRWLRPLDAAQALGVGTKTVAGYAEQGLVQRNARGLYDAASVDALARERDARKAERDAARAARKAAAAARRRAARAALTRTE